MAVCFMAVCFRTSHDFLCWPCHPKFNTLVRLCQCHDLFSRGGPKKHDWKTTEAREPQVIPRTPVASLTSLMRQMDPLVDALTCDFCTSNLPPPSAPITAAPLHVNLASSECMLHPVYEDDLLDPPIGVLTLTVHADDVLDPPHASLDISSDLH